MLKKFFAFAFIIIILTASCAESANKRARFLFIGDIMAHKQQLDAARYKGKDKLLAGTYDFSPQFRRIRPLLIDSFLVGNLETTFSGKTKKLNYSGYPMFNTPDSLADTLKNYLEVDLLTLANNHIFDRGAAGARRTTEILDSQDIKWTGLGLDKIPSNDAVILENDGIKAAFISYSYGSNLWPKSNDVHLNTLSQENILTGLKHAKSLSPDVIIACYHWGYEYHYNPNIYQKNDANTTLNNGVTLIVGTHPHVLQPVEVRISDKYPVKAVAWSLGNFVSFQRTLPRERTYILAAEFEKDNNGKTRLVKLSAAPLYVLAPGQNKTEIIYTGTHEDTINKLDFTGLSKAQIAKFQRIGRATLDFLGASGEIDDYGFYTLWKEESFDVLPVSRRKSPKD